MIELLNSNTIWARTWKLISWTGWLYMREVAPLNEPDNYKTIWEVKQTNKQKRRFNLFKDGCLWFAFDDWLLFGNNIIKLINFQLNQPLWIGQSASDFFLSILISIARIIINILTCLLKAVEGRYNLIFLNLLYYVY